MKLNTLKAFFLNRADNTKVYIIDNRKPETFLLTGVAFNPREQCKVLLIDVGPYLVYSFARDYYLSSISTFRGLRLTDDSIITRRFNTHRRNVLRLCNPEKLPGLATYLEKARVFGQESTTD